MRIDVHVYHHLVPDEHAPPWAVALCDQLTRVETNMSAISDAMDKLTSEVAETKAGVDSAVTLIRGLSDQLRENAGNPDAIRALADQLDASQRDLADAVTSAGTQPANPPAPPPTA